MDDPFAQAYLESQRSPDAEEPTGHDEDLPSDRLQQLASAAIDRYTTTQGQALEHLRSVVVDVDPLPLLSGMFLLTALRPWGTYFEPDEPSTALEMELVVSIVASQPPPTTRRAATPGDLKSVAIAARHVHYWAQLLQIAHKSMGDGSIRAAIRNELLTRWMSLRGAAYSGHAEEAARALVDEYDHNLQSKIGFGLQDLIDLSKALYRHREQSISPALDTAWRHATKVSGESPSSTADASDRFIDEWLLAAMRLLPDALAVPSTRQVELPGATRSRRQEAILRTLGRRSGDFPVVTSVFVDPPQRVHPFLLLPAPLDGETRASDEVAMLVDFQALSTNLHLTMESLLSTIFPRSHAPRARAVDRRSIDLLQRALPRSTAVRNVFLDGPGGRAEVDGVVLYDDIAIVVEGKGAPLKLAARRGSTDRFIDQVRDLVGGGYAQLDRDRAYLLNGRPARFYDEHDQCVLSVDGTTIRRCYQLMPCLDGLGQVGTSLHQLADLGILPPDARPWIVGITDLNVVIDILRRPAELIGYLEFRHRWTHERRLILMDEFEMLTLYLHQVDLAHHLAGSPVDRKLMPAPSQTLYDAWYHGLEGEGPMTVVPKIWMTTRIRRFVDDLQRRKPEGWLASATAALQIPRAIAETVDKRQAALAAEVRHHRFLVTGESDYAIIVAAQDEPWTDVLTDPHIMETLEETWISLLLKQRGGQLQLDDVRMHNGIAT